MTGALYTHAGIQMGRYEGHYESPMGHWHLVGAVLGPIQSIGISGGDTVPPTVDVRGMPIHSGICRCLREDTQDIY